MTTVVRPVRPLPELLEALRDRGLRQGVSTPSAGPMPPRPALPTGHPALDTALGTDGWPRGALVLLDAPVGAGATTLALQSLAATQAAGGVVAYLDPAGSLDPAVAARLGVSLEWLLVVRPADAGEAVELAAWLARDGRIDAMVLDLADADAAPRNLDRLAHLLARSGGVTLLLTGVAAAGRQAAGVRVALRRRAWLGVGRDLVGQRVEAVVERHRWALAGGRAELDLFFAEGRRIDALLHAAAEERAEERGATLQVVVA
jgi:recA bacterial DNA recombination protein